MPTPKSDVVLISWENRDSIEKWVSADKMTDYLKSLQHLLCNKENESGMICA